MTNILPTLHNSSLLSSIDIYCQCYEGNNNNIRKLIQSSSQDNQHHIFEACAEFGHLEFLKDLVTINPKIIKENPKALPRACSNNQLQVAIYLIESGIDFSTSNHKSLRDSSQYGYVDIVDYLLMIYEKNNLLLKVYDIINEYGNEHTKKWLGSKLLSEQLDKELPLQNVSLKLKI